MKDNWKTTTAAILVMISAITAGVAAAIDNDPTTIADWGAIGVALVAGFGLLFAKDADV